MHWRFSRFQLDCESACLWEGEQRLTLRPKTFDLLVYWVAHAGELDVHFVNPVPVGFGHDNR